MTLDLIIPHYNESYDVVRPGLQMLEIQQKVKPGDFRVLFINDGEERKLSELENYDPPFPFVEYSIPHGGVSVARNFGIEHSDADWVMFCDCDDCFSSLYSIYEMVSVLDTKEKDLLWIPYYFDFPGKERRVVNKFELTFIIGKIFRRSFLMQHQLRFNSDLTYTEDTSFLHVVGMEIHPDRIGKINSNMPLAAYLHRPESVSCSQDLVWKNSMSLFHGQMYLAEENQKRNRMDTYHNYVIRAMTDAYAALNRIGLDIDRSEFDREAWEYWKDRQDSIQQVDAKAIDNSVLRSVLEFRTPKAEYENYIPFRDWLAAWTRIHEQEESKSK